MTDCLIDPYNHTGYAQVLAETTGSTVTYYTIGDDVLAQTVDGTIQYLLYDGHGSTRQLVDTAGAVVNDPDRGGVQSFSYDAYGVMLGGNPQASTDTATNLLYSGEQFDTSAQQYYLLARYYNQNNGTFNRVDPYAGNTQDPQSLHKYAYVHNNPVNNIDPTGMFSMGGLVASVAIGVMLQGIYIGSYTSAMAASAERIYGHASDLNFLVREKERDNATIIVHGIAPHNNGWSNEKGFIDELEARANNQDYYEFTWSGFSLTGTFGINRGVHDVATNNLIRAARIVQQKGYSKVNIISHSWGTVLSRDAQGSISGIDTWVTMGSPLNRETTVSNKPKHWINIWSKGDVVDRYIPPALSLIIGGAGHLYQNTAVNHQVKISGGHGSYWTNSIALDTIGTRLAGQ